MDIALTCRQCGHVDRPTLDTLPQWRCPGCEAAPEPRAAEDLASALEDAAAQLWWMGQAVDLEVKLSTATIPPDFLPEG